MDSMPLSLQKVIDAFSKLPGIGKKTAHRLGLYILKSKKLEVEEFSRALIDLKENINTCEVCHNYSEAELCKICSSDRRDKRTICVCEDPSDIYLLEKTGYNGLYHVLGGLISPLDGVGPDEINFKSLHERSKSVDEIIIATDANVEGDATSLFIHDSLESSNVKVTRLARGLPMGGHLEYIDEATLTRSITDRVEI